MKTNIIQNTLLFLLIGFYLFAGFNHFASPTFYLPVIPPYLSLWAKEINIMAGVVEISLALLLIPNRTRLFAAKCLVIMLIALYRAIFILFKKENSLLDPLR